MLIWTPVLAQVASYSEIDMYWSIDDLMQCNEMLEIKNALESAEYEKLQKK